MRPGAAGRLFVLAGIAAALAGAYDMGAGRLTRAAVAIGLAWVITTIGAALQPPGDWTA